MALLDVPVRVKLESKAVGDQRKPQVQHQDDQSKPQVEDLDAKQGTAVRHDLIEKDIKLAKGL